MARLTYSSHVLLRLHAFLHRNARAAGLLAALLLALAPSAALAIATDADGDGVLDHEDNCSVLANPDQNDSDLDGYGQLCDPDYNNDGIVGGPDFARFFEAFGTNDATVDLTGDGIVGGPDFSRFLTLFEQTPGPSGLDCAGSIPCVAAPQGAGWVPVTDWNVARVLGTRFQPYALSASNGSTYRHLGDMIWTKTSNATIDLAASDDDLFKLLDGGIVARRRADLGWVGIGSSMADLHAGGSGLFATREDGHLMAYECFCGLTQRSGWTEIGTPGWQIDVGSLFNPNWPDDVGIEASLYRLDASGVWSFHFDTMTWNKIGGPAGRLYAGGDKLYATNPNTGDLYAYDVYDGSWRWVSAAAAEFAVDEQTGALIKLTVDRSSIWQLDDSDRWVKIGGPAGRIWMASQSAWATSPSVAELWQRPLY